MATLAQLKTLAKDLGIKGYSSLKKDDLAAAIDAKYREMDGTKRMSNTKRAEVYRADRNGGKLSARQERRMRKSDNKDKR